MAHTNAIYSPPGVGGILLEQPPGDFRIDHDQSSTPRPTSSTVFEKSRGVGGPVLAATPGSWPGGGQPGGRLGPDRRSATAIGFFCGSKSASLGAALTTDDCTTSNYGATRLRIRLREPRMM
jgi:hypothetical protein